MNLITSGWLVALVLAAQAGPLRIKTFPSW
jgi:hypothetical protein